MATSRKRMIDPAFFFDEELAECSERARLLYIGLWGLSCDINFTLPNKPQWIKAQVFPYTNLDITIPIQELEKIGKLIPFTAEDGKVYYHLPNMKKYQKIDHPTLKYPAFIANSVNPPRTIPESSDSSSSQYNVIQPNSNKEILADKSALKVISKHKEFIDWYFKTCAASRNVSVQITAAAAKNLKSALKNQPFEELQKRAVYYLCHSSFKEFSPGIETFLSAGVQNGIANKAKNGEEYWKDLERFSTRYIRPEAPKQGMSYADMKKVAMPSLEMKHG